MPATTTMFRAARPVMFQRFPAAGARLAGRRTAGRRFQSTSSSAEHPAAPQQPQSWFKRMWNSPIGLKTVHFWAPVMKWALVVAGISDFARPAEKLSVTQNAALTATGMIWTRWCFVIRPQNLLLAAVNFFLAGVGVTQLARIASYHRSLKGTAAEAEAEVKDAAAVVASSK
ncbi:putative upf0041 domain protein [Eutypa lata UCREL1]|uniref:Mitochondrial pyruvate carrier n=1 Tax=Eutypa lata (strain UCR-EL1) TaxID=1287681 RepID=M7T6H4_EUTLA|nr:putative upf0041 domain protein [Eutypa lata UCREL1]